MAIDQLTNQSLPVTHLSWNSAKLFLISFDLIVKSQLLLLCFCTWIFTFVETHLISPMTVTFDAAIWFLTCTLILSYWLSLRSWLLETCSYYFLPSGQMLSFKHFAKIHNLVFAESLNHFSLVCWQLGLYSYLYMYFSNWTHVSHLNTYTQWRLLSFRASLVEGTASTLP